MGGSYRDGRGIRCNFGCPLSRAGVNRASTCLVLPVTKGNSYFSPLCFAKQAVGRRRMEGGRLQRDNPAGPGDGDAAVAGLSSVPSVLGAPLQPGLGFSSSSKSFFHHLLPSPSLSPCQDSFVPLHRCVLGCRSWARFGVWVPGRSSPSSSNPGSSPHRGCCGSAPTALLCNGGAGVGEEGEESPPHPLPASRHPGFSPLLGRRKALTPV